MYKIGEFSILSKTTIKTLRFYEKEGLFLPSFVDENGYRYYEANKLLELCKIVSLRQIGLGIKEIKQVLNGAKLDEFLTTKLTELENLQRENSFKISKINYLLGENSMKYEVITKDLPEYIVYYKEGIIKSMADASEFILKSGEECLSANPKIKCIEPDYCFMEYLDGEYKEKDVHVRYTQAVTEFGNETDEIKFKKLKPVKAVCIYHKGSYENLSEAYSFIMNYIAENNLEIIASPRERYIDGIWNKESIEDWLTEIQVPVKSII
ncbi:MAG: MerR family transcriptional regulator [Christensenellales bacterium]